MSRRTISSIWTFLSQELFTIVSVLAAMLCTPLLLRWLGDERYGAFETVTAWAGYVALIEGGVGEAIQALLGRAFGKRNRADTKAVLAASLRIYSRLALIMIAVGAALTPFISHLIPVNAAKAGDLRLAWVLGLCVAPLLPFNAFRVLAQVEQRGYQVNAVLIGNWALVTGCSLIFAWAGWGISGQALAVVAGALFFALAMTASELRRLHQPVVSLFRDPVDPEVRRELSQLRWSGLVFNLCGTFNFMTDNIIVAYVLSPIMVVPFFITQRLPTLAMRELQGIGGSSWAALTELHNLGEKGVFEERLVELTRLTAILAVACLVPIVAYNRYFVQLWVGQSRFGGNLLTEIAACNALLLAVFSLWSWVIASTGHQRRILPGMVTQTVVNFSSSVAFTFAFGLIGPVLGTFVSFVGIGIWYIPLVMKEIFEIRVARLWGALLSPIALGVPYAILAIEFATSYGAADWFTIGWQMAALAGLYLSVAAATILSRSELAQWVSRIRFVVAPSSSAS